MRRIGKIIVWLLASIGTAGVIGIVVTAVLVSRIGEA